MSNHAPKTKAVNCLQYISGMFQSGAITLGQSKQLTDCCRQASETDDFSELFSMANSIYSTTNNPSAKMLVDYLFN